MTSLLISRYQHGIILYGPQDYVSQPMNEMSSSIERTLNFWTWFDISLFKSAIKTWCLKRYQGDLPLDIILFQLPWKRKPLDKKIRKYREAIYRWDFVDREKAEKFVKNSGDIWGNRRKTIICCTQCLFHGLEHIYSAVHAPRKPLWSTDITEKTQN